MHDHFYTFEGQNRHEIGEKVGETFRDEIVPALAELKRSPKWDRSREMDAKSLEFTKKKFPAYVEELEGYAQGANIELLDAWSLCIEDDSAAYVEENPEHCTTVITNSGKLVAHNEDAASEFDQEKISIVRKVLPTVTTMELYYATSLGGTAVGANSFGYVQTINTLFHSTISQGIPRVVISRFLLETKDPTSDLAFVSSLPKMSGYHHALIKNTGEMWNVEFNSSNEQLEKKELPYVHTNHCVFDPSRTFPDDWSTLTRYKKARELVRDDMSFEELASILKDTSTPPHPIFNKYTMGQAIIDFQKSSIFIWLRREEEKGFVEYSLPLSG
jgi:isopenicillin-N N-acyltransferase-like protein